MMIRTGKRWMLGMLGMFGAMGAGAEVVSGPLSPQVEAEFTADGGAALLTIRAENPFGGAVAGRCYAGGWTKIDKFPAQVKIPDGKSTRLGVEISWFRPDGTLRQREVFFTPDEAGQLPADPNRIAQFDVAGAITRAAEQGKRLRFPVKLRAPGVISAVIEDAAGNRVRNLAAEQSFPAGTAWLEWDGRNDFGNPAEPGKYRLRYVTHPGIRHEFLMQFENGDETLWTPWGTNHTLFTNVAAAGDRVYVASPFTEGGESIVELTLDGKFVRAFPQIHGSASTVVFTAVGDGKLFIVKDGPAVWSNTGKQQIVTLNVYDLKTGKPLELNRKMTNILHESKKSGAITVNTAGTDDEIAKRATVGLSGAAFANGKLWISNRENDTLTPVDPVTAVLGTALPLPGAGPLTVENGVLYAASGNDLVKLDSTGRLVKVCRLGFAPIAIAVRNGAVAASGHPDSTVKLFRLNGQPLRTIGEPGGRYAGKWKPKRMFDPMGLAFASDGKLWTAESRWNPKRIVRWNPENGEILYEKYGSPAYGSSSAGFDPDDATRWFADGVEWKIDYKNKTARVVNVLLARNTQGGVIGPVRNYQLTRDRGNLYAVGSGHIATVSRYQPDGSLRLFAAVSNVRSFDRSGGRIPAFGEALDRAFPNEAKNPRKRTMRYEAVVWYDRNGNGKFDADEFMFSEPGSAVTGDYWGLTSMGTTFRIPFRSADGKFRIIELAASGFRKDGTFAYDLQGAIDRAAPIAATLPVGSRGPLDGGAFTDLRDGVIVNSTPQMLSFGRDGKLKWFFPNRWTNVHGSHNAPMPRPGEFQGVLFPVGVAPLDRTADVMALNGNHGSTYFITTDGFFLGSIFSDCRVASSPGPDVIGGEPFGGVFQYDRKNRRYLLQNGNSGYRIYQIHGLDRVRRGGLDFTASREQLEVAGKLNPAVSRRAGGPKTLTIPFRNNPDLRSLPRVASWYHGALGIQVGAAYDARNLYLSYNVQDLSPWVNNGTVWSNRFKTGDCVDFQLATDEKLTGKSRRDAAPGDIRLLLGGSDAVLYRHRVKEKTPELNPMEFTSPWRSARVDDVKKLELRPALERRTDGYQIRFAVPLNRLGLPAALKGKKFNGDFGVIFGDDKGTVNLARSYWANPETGLVNDVPGEMLPPVARYGTIIFE